VINLSKEITIHWFRQDLRIEDNPSLIAAAQQGTVLPIYVLDDEHSGEHQLGAASRWWLHHSLRKLNESLDGALCVYAGDPQTILGELIARLNIKALCWNRCYEPWRTLRDKEIKEALRAHGTDCQSFNGSLLWEPWKVLKSDGTPYKVFTPYYRKRCLTTAPPREPLPKPDRLTLQRDTSCSLTIDDLGLLPKTAWDKKLEPHWKIGEEGAQEKLAKFIDNRLADYKEGRNFPAKQSVSRLSPHLHFGEISPNQAWYAAKSLEDSDDLDHFLSELGWREFSHCLLHYFPELPNKNLQPKFDRFPWVENRRLLEAWQSGRTGHPLVDAGMRELWETGYMHNRVRMVVGSFLVKNLLLHWHHGERWFWDCLVDADLANNSASWQWIAGCGADAAPFFRVFNPSTQGSKFDPTGQYTRRYVPELGALPDKYLFRPWEAPSDVLKQAEIVLGTTYPEPVVDLKKSRVLALDAFQSLKGQR
jgi:deoxyribodipyrimidine photo-lyase